MTINIEAVNTALSVDHGEASDAPPAEPTGVANTWAAAAAHVHRAAFGADAANNSTLYLLAALVAGPSLPSGPDAAAEWVSTQLGNPFPPSLAELGAGEYVDAAMFAAQERFVWQVGAEVAAATPQVAELLAAVDRDDHGVPFTEVNSGTSEALMRGTTDFVRRCAEALADLRAHRSNA